MTELTVRQLAARLDDVEERHDKALAELRSLRAEGAPAAKIEAAEEKVETTEAKVKSAEEEIAEAKATLKRHGYELDESEERSGEAAETAPVSEEAPTADDAVPAAKAETSAQEPPKEKPAKPKPDEAPEQAHHWYDSTVNF